MLFEQFMQGGPLNRQSLDVALGNYTCAGDGVLEKRHFTANIAIRNLGKFCAARRLDESLAFEDKEKMPRPNPCLNQYFPDSEACNLSLFGEKSPVLRREVLEAVLR